MWPDLLTQVADLLPQLDRIAPMADRLLASKAASDAAVLAMAENVGKDLARVNETSQGLSRQLTELSTQMTDAARGAEEARSLASALGHSVVSLNREVRSLRKLLLASLILLVILFVLFGWLALSRAH